MKYMEVLIGYLIFINIISLVAYAMDKHKAKKKKWRIPERNLLLAALLGGSVGALIGVFGLRHKSRHLKFVLGVPIIFALHVIFAVYFIL
jgi:uncharacterized membrane protein YsdA (DUF1294 family)